MGSWPDKGLINKQSINVFNTNIKKLNDKHNKIRESIICLILNNKIPDTYYVISKWHNLKKALFDYISNLTNNKYNKIECIPKAGRSNKYDFKIIITNDNKTKSEYLIEFKFNIKQINQAPQFVSPMKPSQYLTLSYEEFFEVGKNKKISQK